MDTHAAKVKTETNDNSFFSAMRSNRTASSDNNYLPMPGHNYSPMMTHNHQQFPMPPPTGHHQFQK